MNVEIERTDDNRYTLTINGAYIGTFDSIDDCTEIITDMEIARDFQ